MLFSKGKKEKEQLNLKVTTLEERLSVATNFLEKISSGDFKTVLPLLESQKEKSGNFYQTLQQVSVRLSQYAQEEAERKWMADGMTKFMSILGGSNRNSEHF